MSSNLRPLSSDEARENGRKGGIASGKSRRRKKRMKEQLDLLLSKSADLKSMPNGEEIKEQIKAWGISEEEIDNQMLLIVSLFQTALRSGKNQVPAFIALRDTVGDKPIDKQEIKEVTSSWFKPKN